MFIILAGRKKQTPYQQNTVLSFHSSLFALETKILVECVNYQNTFLEMMPVFLQSLYRTDTCTFACLVYAGKMYVRFYAANLQKYIRKY